MTRTDYPLIETWGRAYDWKAQKPHEARPLVTSQSPTVFLARQSRAKALGVPVHEVMGRKLDA